MGQRGLFERIPGLYDQDLQINPVEEKYTILDVSIWWSYNTNY
jgi:hypothetical protein